MTRETKIGLLVGLAFIIVIGILLSDHMTSTTQPPQAALTDAAPNVRESVTPPTSGNPVQTTAINTPPITPSNQVPTATESRQPVNTGPVVTRIEVGGPAGAQQTGGPVAIKQTETNVAEQPGDPTKNLENWASGQNAGGEPVIPKKETVAVATKREYTVVAGDSLSKIAAKTLGSASKANIDLIIKANPSLQNNPDLVVEGRKYVIPTPGTTAAATPTSASIPAPVAGATGTAAIPETVPVGTKPVPVTELVDPLPTSGTSKDGTTWYVVKDNDNLWKIAAAQLGSGNAWTQIKEMNKDILKGGETVQPNMRLRLPPKPLASAAN